MTYLSHFWAILAQKVISREKVKTTVFAIETTQNWPKTYFFDILIPKMMFLRHFWAILAQKVTSREKVKNNFFLPK